MTAARPKKISSKSATSPRTAGDSISRMPRDVRDRISRALADGATWKRVAKIAAEAGYPGVTAQNVTNYRQGGHRDWLKKEERLEAIRAESDVTAQILKFYADNGGSPAEAGVLAAADMMARALQGMDVGTLQELMADNPGKFLSIANSLTSMAKFFAEQRATSQAAQAQTASTATAAPELSPEERSRKIKEAFGMS